ncbi:MAG: pilus assembly protein [Alphaproteobacteria bacterium]|nr:pilus assembly protein [Alphaproteobacteria bacterium]
MIRRFHDDRDGVAAIEFAITAPLLIMTTLAGIGCAMALWHWNSLQSVARTTARCVALNSVLCEAVPAGCASGDAGVCYALAQVKDLSFDQTLTGSQITINRNDSIDGTAMTTVSITQPFSLLLTSYTLTATSSFPN